LGRAQPLPAGEARAGNAKLAVPIAMGYRSGENPAQWKGAALSHLLPPISKVRTVEHHKAVPYKDVPALMAELRNNDSVSARALMFTILTVSRTGETRGAERAEIDKAQKVWVCHLSA